MEMLPLSQVMMKIGLILPHEENERKVVDKLLQYHHLETLQYLRMQQLPRP